MADDVMPCANCGRPVTMLGARGYGDWVYCTRPRCREQYNRMFPDDAADDDELAHTSLHLTPDTIHTIMDFSQRVEAGEIDPYYAATGIPREDWIEVEVGDETYLARNEAEAQRVRQFALAKQHFDSVRDQEEDDSDG